MDRERGSRDKKKDPITKKYRLKPGTETDERISPSLDLRIQFTDKRALVSIEQDDKVLYEDCQLSKIYDTNGEMEKID